MRVVVTGSRKWARHNKVYSELSRYFFDHGPFHLIHGACATGADALAEQWFQVAGQYLGCTIERFPAAWETRGKAAGPERNWRMVHHGVPDLVLAFPLPEGRGTQHTIKLAREAGIEVKVIER
ncbi:SLOG family protein [Streptomyces sp. NPDC087851]|uniref:SLOG family protein n=1 Tax=Streptomyces sp. NPDC087851 TaxID=3365810 RepID=UPI0038300D07